MRTKTLALFLALMGIPTFVLGEVTKVNVASRASVANGQAFGKTGPYEKLTGTIEFAVDPREPHNARITDIARAMPGADKRVHFTSDLMVLKPLDPSKGNGVLLFEVVNRGNILLLNKMNSAASSRNPSTPEDFGNGYLMREGYTLVFVGWEFDLAPGILRVEAPRVDALIDTITVPFILDARENETVLDDAPLYTPANPTDASSVLTIREHYWDKPTTIARTRWRFVTDRPGPPRLAIEGGFEPGRLYEVTFKATGARVAGVGLAAIRDAASAFRYRTDLPVHGTTLYVQGESQDGRFLRQFLYDGFNADEQDRRVFDAVWAHIAARRAVRSTSDSARPSARRCFSRRPDSRSQRTNRNFTANGVRSSSSIRRADPEDHLHQHCRRVLGRRARGGADSYECRRQKGFASSGQRTEFTCSPARSTLKRHFLPFAHVVSSCGTRCRSARCACPPEGARRVGKSRRDAA